MGTRKPLLFKRNVMPSSQFFLKNHLLLRVYLGTTTRKTQIGCGLKSQRMRDSASYFTGSIAKAAEWDGIGFLILQKLFPVLKDHLVRLYKAFIGAGYHPKCWREAIGVILSTPNRNMALPKSYRVIFLLNCLGITAEKIVVTKLCYFATTSDLLYYDQTREEKYILIYHLVDSGAMASCHQYSVVMKFGRSWSWWNNVCLSVFRVTCSCGFIWWHYLSP